MSASVCLKVFHIIYKVSLRQDESSSSKSIARKPAFSCKCRSRSRQELWKRLSSKCSRNAEILPAWKFARNFSSNGTMFRFCLEKKLLKPNMPFVSGFSFGSPGISGGYTYSMCLGMCRQKNGSSHSSCFVCFFLCSILWTIGCWYKRLRNQLSCEDRRRLSKVPSKEKYCLPKAKFE